MLRTAPSGVFRAAPIELLVASEHEPADRPRATADLHRVRHRVYAASARWQALAPWDRYLARVHAVALIRPGAVFCHESAAALLGLPVFGEPRDIHVFDVGAPSTHRVGDVVRHTSRIAPTVITCNGIRATAPADTASALARMLPPAFGLAVVDAAISPRQSALTTLTEIEQVRLRTIDPRGIRRHDWILSAASTDPESVGESVSRAVISWLGFAPPRLQHEFRLEGCTDRVDFWWPECGVAGESDGYGKYDPADPAAAHRALTQEKRREDRLRRHVRGFARWDWSDAMRAAPLERALEHAGVPRVAPAQRLMLATLRGNRRSL